MLPFYGADPKPSFCHCSLDIRWRSGVLALALPVSEDPQNGKEDFETNEHILD